MKHVPQPQEDKLDYYFLLESCNLPFKTHVLLRFHWLIFYKWPVIYVTLLRLKIAVHTLIKYKTNIIFSIVKIKLFEFYMFERHKHQLKASVKCISAC